jgi:Anti-anti-sigma regulatory factor (antagonist of anti-sigma factor)
MTRSPSSLPTPLLGRPRRRPQAPQPALRTTVVRLQGDLETRPRELRAELFALLSPDTMLVLDLRGATFLGAGAARLMLALGSQAAASGTRLILWRPNGQPLRTLRIARLERVFDIRPATWNPARSRDRAGPAPQRQEPARRAG